MDTKLDNSPESIRDMMIRLAPASVMILGQTKTNICEFCMSPHTIKEVEDTIKMHYQTIRGHMLELKEMQILIRGAERGKDGHRYQTDPDQLNRYLVASSLGRNILNSSPGIENPLATAMPNKEKFFAELPEPSEPVPMRIGYIHTNTWKFLMSCLSPMGTYEKMPSVLAQAMMHIWYRNYLYSEQKTRPENLPGPTELQTREALKELHLKILSMAEGLKKILDNDGTFVLRPDHAGWRYLGDFPVEFTRQVSETFNKNWNEGVFNSRGFSRTVNDDYTEYKTILDAHYYKVYHTNLQETQQ